MTVRTHVHTSAWVTNLALTTAGALSLALLAQVRIHLPFTPVPITLQVLGVLMLGGLLGPRLGAAAVAQYLLFGLCGLPVLTGWQSVIGQLTLGHIATFGYLLSFIPAAVLYGLITTRFTGRPYTQQLLGGVVAGLAGVLLVYLFGWTWMAYVCHLGALPAFTLGVAPFIVIDLLKTGVAASALALREK